MLGKRVISGVSLIAVLALITLWDSQAARLIFVFGGCLCLQLALREYFQMTARLGHPGFPKLTSLAAVAMVGAAALIGEAFGTRDPHSLWFWQVQADALVFALFIVGAFVLAFRRSDLRAGTIDVLVSISGFLYLGWTLSFLARVYFMPTPGAAHAGRFFFIFFILSTKCGDIGGYTVGKLSKRLAGDNYRLVPRLSPKKSWEGLAGSIAFGAGGACLLVWLLGERLSLGSATLGMPLAAGWGVVAALLGLMGDLAESVLKRASGIKDSGDTLPGMGGLLDVLDSLVFTAPIFYVLLNLWRVLG